MGKYLNFVSERDIRAMSESDISEHLQRCRDGLEALREWTWVVSDATLRDEMIEALEVAVSTCVLELRTRQAMRLFEEGLLTQAQIVMSNAPDFTDEERAQVIAARVRAILSREGD